MGSTFVFLLACLSSAVAFKACVPFTQCDPETNTYLTCGSKDTINERFGESEPTECEHADEVICEIVEDDDCEKKHPQHPPTEHPDDQNKPINICPDPISPTYPPPTPEDPYQHKPDYVNPAPVQPEYPDHPNHHEQSSTSSYPIYEPHAPETHSDGSIVIPDMPAGYKGCGVKRDTGLGERWGGNFDSVTRADAIYGEYPWMIALFKKSEGKYKFICGGSLIEPGVVLTAAHCLVDDLGDFKAEDLKVVAGEWNLKSDVEPLTAQEGKVEKIVIHERYNRGNLINDIGLLFLHEPFEITEVVDVICLAKNSEFTPDKCRATGWGVDDFTSDDSHRHVLRKVALPLVDRETCQEKLRTTKVGKFFKLHSGFMCAGGYVHEDTCKGDGGGPLVCSGAHGDNVRFAQVGIVSWGIDCGTESPGVYSSIDYHFDWIHKHVHLKNSREAVTLHGYEKSLGDYANPDAKNSPLFVPSKTDNLS